LGIVVIHPQHIKDQREVFMSNVYFVVICFVLGTAQAMFAQPLSVPLPDAERYGISVTDLDERYPSATNADPTKGVMGQHQSRFLAEYTKLLKEVGHYLSEHGVDWGERTAFVHRIYFAADGSIDYFLFNTQGTELDKDKISRLLTSFGQNFRLSITANTTFRQCGTVTFVSAKKD
jgi:hypothetical protein